MVIENNEMRGTLTLQLSDRRGQVVHEARCPNRIVTTGRRLVAQRFAGQVTGVPPTEVTHMAVGTGGATPSDADTTLEAERAPRIAISAVDYSEIDEESIRRVRTRLTAVFDFDDANGPEPLQEAGIFTADTGGDMYNRVTFEPVSKTNAFKLTLLWDIVF